MYEKSKSAFSMELFQQPTSEYRGAPFWSWNGALKQETLEKQIDVMKKMGLGGYHIHSRIGLETEYLGEEFMRLVKHCERYGAQQGMLTWLYDEDKWPSGAGGGRVACDEKYASRYLLFSPNVYEEGFLDRKMVATSRLSNNGTVSLLHRYDVALEDGKLVSYRMLSEGDTGSNVWYAYLLVTEPLDWFNKQPYGDTLNADAIRRFIEVTHEPYFKAVGHRFSETIPAIFTDEPSFHKLEQLPDGNASRDVGIAYTDSMEDYFRRRYGYSLLEHLPEVFWERADGLLSKVRYHYHDCTAWMFAEAYGKTIGDWCADHNLLMTGHLLFEEKLESQTRVVGEVMRTLRHFTLPGVDMLADRHEYTTVKQAQSVARQYGYPGVLSELYGVTNWDFDFRGHKHQGDWQAALGVTNRVHHLVWMTMGGESKRDYPSPMDEHATWSEQYSIIEDYFARLNVALTRGNAGCRIAVVHPVESYWMLMGPDRDTAHVRRELEDQFQDVTEWLLFNLLDFDYASEALLPEQYRQSADRKLHLGQMAYEVVVVPGMITMRASTLQALKAFAGAGGRVIFMGRVPSYVDGVPSDEVKEFANQCHRIGYEKYALLDLLQPYRDVEIQKGDFLRSDRLIYQLREDDGAKWLFIAQGKPDDRLELSHWVSQTGREDFTVRVRGTYDAEQFDPNDGSRHSVQVLHENGWTVMQFGFYAQDSVLLRLHPAKALQTAHLVPDKEAAILSETYLPSFADYALSEPNVLVLDRAQYSLDDGPWQEAEEMLRMDASVRRACGYQLRTANFPQPWLEPVKPVEHMIQLRYSVSSQMEKPSVELAFEFAEGAQVTWNGQAVPMEPSGFFVDASIQRLKLGALRQGENELLIRMPFGPGVDLENGYLLGDFGVRVTGDRAVLEELPQKLAFGSIVHQGLPFYGGNLTYSCTIETDGSDVMLEIPEYFAVLLHIELDGQSRKLYAEPYRVTFTDVPAGQHTLSITMYGSRINTFGQLHNSNRKERYWGNKTWRTTGKNWSYAYQLRQVGVIVPPILRTIGK